ncbi:MAG TPA: sigma-E factor regulatory protein RseB domain-containing protein [Candidatus Baltobacteraceae bacterium]|nr:sigma-E factor regulatory protein RseB domain-containing protein [Candidatus Baltobacteraceae bacterium]
MRRTGNVAGAILAAAVLTAAAFSRASAQENATQLLRDAAAAYAKTSYIGQVQNVDYGSKRADAVMFRIEHRAPNTTRRWYLAPESLYGDSIISIGDTSYNVDTHHNRILVVKDDAIDDQVAQDENFGLLLHNYNAVLAPDDNVAGRRALSVVLVNKYSGQSVMRISIDAQTKLVLAKERYASSGAVSHQMRIEQIRYTNSLPAQLFSIPGNYPRVEGPQHGLSSSDLPAVIKTAGFKAVGPTYLPGGFVPVAGDVSDIKGVRTLHLLYSDGLRTVSLFENAKGAAVDLGAYTAHSTSVRSNAAQYVEDGSTTLLTWAQGNLHLALVGELTRTELVKIGSSVSS